MNKIEAFLLDIYKMLTCGDPVILAPVHGLEDVCSCAGVLRAPERDGGLAHGGYPKTGNSVMGDAFCRNPIRNALSDGSLDDAFLRNYGVRRKSGIKGISQTVHVFEEFDWCPACDRKIAALEARVAELTAGNFAAPKRPEENGTCT